MSNNDNRRPFQPKKKYEVLKEVLIGKTPVSEVCKRWGSKLDL